jgi:hypothetical protein
VLSVGRVRLQCSIPIKPKVPANSLCPTRQAGTIPSNGVRSRRGCQHMADLRGGEARPRHLRREKGGKRWSVGFMKILFFGLFALALFTGATAMIVGPMPASTVALVQTAPTLPDWRRPSRRGRASGERLAGLAGSMRFLLGRKIEAHRTDRRYHARYGEMPRNLRQHRTAA